MAKLIVENASVERVFQTQYGWGVNVVETWTPKGGGDPRKSYFTLWFDDKPNVEVGQIVSASGIHSAKSRVLDNGRAATDVSVKFARLIDAAPPIAPAPSTDDLAWREPEPPAEDPWATSGGGWG